MMNFRNYPQITKVVIPDNVQLSHTTNLFSNMRNLQSVYLPKHITIYNNTFRDCISLQQAVCGDNVTNMDSAYRGCTNLTTAVCGDKVTNMANTYYGCKSLTTAVCGDNVTNMSHAYSICTNLTTAVCGDNVTNMHFAYYGCTKIQGNMYIYSKYVIDFNECFQNRDVSNMLNLYIQNGSTSLTSAMKATSSTSLTGTAISWTNEMSNMGCYYNTAYNIYIYPVSNVADARINNGD